jgi:hypothetical protein
MFAQIIMKFLHFMNHENPLPFSQNPATGPNPEPDQSSHAIKLPFKDFPRNSFPSAFATTILCAFMFSPAHFTLREG